jgi:hypothetical protein
MVIQKVKLIVVYAMHSLFFVQRALLLQVVRLPSTNKNAFLALQLAYVVAAIYCAKPVPLA